MKNNDEELSEAEKLELIYWIPVRQKERWQRMKFFHSCEKLPLNARHYFMGREIELMRDQQKRLMALKESLDK